MRILTALTYYRPHTSGLTIYAERLARSLVRRGHEVTVLTSRYEPHLPLEETVDGVRIRRVPVALRIGKGVLMPSFGPVATGEILRHDALLLHLPQFDAAGLALRGRVLRRPTVLTYHCDLQLPPGPLNRLTNATVDLMNHIAGRAAHRVVAYTDDFASHSPYLRRLRRKLEVILPPVELPSQSRGLGEGVATSSADGPVIGMASRLASEKGVQVLLDALPRVMERFPRARVLFAGQYEGVWGEAEYAARLRPRIDEHRTAGRWHFLGVLSAAGMVSFFEALDVLVVPSLNSTESFGLVQIEGMMKGVPAVASDLPGVRQPVRMTGMGEVVPIGDAPALADAIVRVLEHPARYGGDAFDLVARFHPDRTAEAYERLFRRIALDLGRSTD